MSAGGLALVALIPGIHAFITFEMFHQDWHTWVYSVSAAEAVALFLGRKGWI